MKRCSICNGAGFVIKKNEETGEEEGMPCECRKDRDEANFIRMKLVSADIPPVFWEYTFDNYLSLIATQAAPTKASNKKSLETFKALIEDPDKLIKNKNFNVLWIWGNEKNAGHTSLAVILATEILKKNYSVRFITMHNILAAFTSFDTKVEFFKDFNTSNIFIIDNAFDPGRCTIKGEYSIVHLYNWLNDALSNNKKIICTSKVPVSQIDHQFQQSKDLVSKHAYELEFKGAIPEHKKELF